MLDFKKGNPYLNITKGGTKPVSAAPLGSYLGNRVSTRVAVMTGGLLSSIGLIISSFAPSLPFLYISLGILTGETPIRSHLCN